MNQTGKPKARGDAGNGVYPEPISSLLGTTLANLGLEKKLTECKALLAWDVVAGSPLDQHARPLRLRHGRLELAVPSPVWRTQLSFLKDDVKRRINASVGAEIVREVVLINQPLPGELSEPESRLRK